MRNYPLALPVRLPLAAALILAIVLSPATASAQAEATTGIVRGTVRDPGGAPVAGAVVLIEHRETGFRTTVETPARARSPAPCSRSAPTT